MIDYHNKMEVERYHQAVNRSTRGEMDDTVQEDVPRFVPCFGKDIPDASPEPAPKPAREERLSQALSSSPSDDAEDCVVGPWYERDVKVEASTKEGSSQTLTISIRRRRLRVEPDKIYEGVASIVSFDDLIYESAFEKGEPVGQASTQCASSPCMEPKPSRLILQGSEETVSEEGGEGGGWVTDSRQNCSELSAVDDGDIDDVDRLAAMFGIVSRDTESAIESPPPASVAGHTLKCGSTSAAVECSDMAEVGRCDPTPAEPACVLNHVTPERRHRRRDHARGPRQAPKRGPVAGPPLTQQTTAVRLVRPKDLEA